MKSIKMVFKNWIPRPVNMLRDEPATLYIYECIKIDKDDNIKTVKKIDGKTVIGFHYQIGELFFSKTNDLNDEYYKFKGTYRPAFVGDMQEKLDKAYGHSNMRNYAETTPQPHHTTIYDYKIIYEKVTCWQFLKKWFNKTFHLSREKNNDDINGIDEYLFGDNNKPSAYWEDSSKYSEQERDIY